MIYGNNVKINTDIDRWLESQVSLKGEQDEPIK